MWSGLNDREREARRAVVTLIAAGVAPDEAALTEALGCPQAAAAARLNALVAKGCISRDEGHGGIVAAYPLSTRPTRHRVTPAGGRRVHALCAMDALGVSPLFATASAIESTCPHCERGIRLEVWDGQVRRVDPPSTALWYARADLLERPIEGLNLSVEQ